MKVKSESEVTQSYPTLGDPMDCGLPGSSIHGIFQARVLEWGAIAFSDQKLLQLINEFGKVIGYKNFQVFLLKKLKLELPYDLATPLLSIYPEKTII